MSKMIKTSLVVLSLLAGASVGYAADNNRDGSRPGDRSGNHFDSPALEDREEMRDPSTTGSINQCDSGAYDEFGNCIVDPDMQ